jgi:hypothetical protein
MTHTTHDTYIMHKGYLVTHITSAPSRAAASTHTLVSCRAQYADYMRAQAYIARIAGCIIPALLMPDVYTPVRARARTRLSLCASIGLPARARARRAADA